MRVVVTDAWLHRLPDGSIGAGDPIKVAEDDRSPMVTVWVAGSVVGEAVRQL